ncbi:MAG: hypothetical protein RL149_742 [Actinomycetota bacterium]|jgi:shikimate dehydrogenase
MAKHFAVLGSPIQHSKSPQIHLAAYRKLGFDWTYERFEVTESGFNDFFASKSSCYGGFSVTMPLKEVALAVSDSADDMAVRTQLANTLVSTADGWHASNTDVFGISQALTAHGVDNLQRVLLLGAGATARSAVVALSGMNPNVAISILGRTATRVNDLIAFAASQGVVATAFEPEAQSVDLTVSTLPAGTFRGFAGDLLAAGTLFDVAYNPWPSDAATHWQAAGLPIINGIHMLIWQAIAQIRLFSQGSNDNALADEVGLAKVMLAAAQQPA